MANSAQGTPSSGLARYLPLFLSAFIIGGGVLAYFSLPDFQQFCQEAWQLLTSGDEARVADWVAQFGFWGPALLLILFLVQMLAFVIPSWLLILVCILAYGPWWGSGLALTGILLASASKSMSGGTRKRDKTKQLRVKDPKLFIYP